MQTNKVVALMFDPIAAQSIDDPNDHKINKEQIIGLLRAEAANGQEELEGLIKKYDRSLRDDPLKKQELFTHQFTPRTESTFDRFPIPDDVMSQMQDFVSGNNNDVGLYLIADYFPGEGMFSNKAFDARALADVVNRLPFAPKKICIVSCKFSNRETHAKAIGQFLENLRDDLSPVVASYSYIVNIDKTGKKTFSIPPSGRGIIDYKKYTKEALKKKLARYFQNYKNFFIRDPITRKYVEDDRHVYTDNKELPVEENQRIVQLRLKHALGLSSGQVKVRAFDSAIDINNKYEVLYRGAQNVYLRLGETDNVMNVPRSQLANIDIDKVNRTDQLALNGFTNDGRINATLTSGISSKRASVLVEDAPANPTEESSRARFQAEEILPKNGQTAADNAESRHAAQSVKEETPKAPVDFSLNAHGNLPPNVLATLRSLPEFANARINNALTGGAIPANSIGVVTVKEKDSDENVLILRSRETTGSGERYVLTLLTARQASSIGRLSMYKKDMERKQKSNVVHRHSATVPSDGPELNTTLQKIKKGAKRIFRG